MRGIIPLVQAGEQGAGSSIPWAQERNMIVITSNSMIYFILTIYPDCKTLTAVMTYTVRLFAVILTL